LRDEIRAIQRKLSITTIFVTHDQEEALSMSDRVVVMHEGIADQIGTPYQIYSRPTTRFVASFVGTLNRIEAKVADPAIGAITIGDATVHTGQPIAAARGAAVTLSLRPEALHLGRVAGHDIVLAGRIADVSFLGSVIRIRVDIGGSLISLDTFNRASAPPPSAGEAVEISAEASAAIVLTD
jgi:putative spermidine/putrescine transport system ATP-binding protein